MDQDKKRKREEDGMVPQLCSFSYPTEDESRKRSKVENSYPSIVEREDVHFVPCLH